MLSFDIFRAKIQRKHKRSWNLQKHYIGNRVLQGDITCWVNYRWNRPHQKLDLFLRVSALLSPAHRNFHSFRRGVQTYYSAQTRTAGRNACAAAHASFFPCPFSHSKAMCAVANLYLCSPLCAMKNPSSFAIENEAGGTFPKQSGSADFLLSENQQSRRDMQLMYFPLIPPAVQSRQAAPARCESPVRD